MHIITSLTSLEVEQCYQQVSHMVMAHMPVELHVDHMGKKTTYRGISFA